MGRRVVIWVLAVVIFLNISCGGGGGLAMPIPPAAITGNNSGGAIAFYQTWRMSDAHSLVEFYAQKLSPEGDFLWGERGILIDSGDAAYYWTSNLYAVSDGSGGAVVIWTEPLPEPPYSKHHVAKIDSGGNVEWQREMSAQIREIKEAIPDGSGGVIIAYINTNDYMSVLKVDAEGNLPWGEDGVLPNPSEYYVGEEEFFDIASDKLGGVIVVLDPDGNLSAQRVDSGGNILWQTGGVQVCVSWPAGEPGVVSDGSGGAIIAYVQYILSGDGKHGYSDSDIYAQRIDAEGNILWGPDGAPVCVEPLLQYSPGIVDDGAGGGIVFFATTVMVGDYPYPASHAQRMDSDGHKLWPEDVDLWPTPYYSLVSDGSGGGINMWYGDNESGAGAQRLDAAGRKLWGPEGTKLTFRDLHSPLAAPDGCGGVLISWSGVKFTGDQVSQVSYYVQRVDAEGNVVWGDDGILLNP
jgi:hypothetical protein